MLAPHPEPRVYSLTILFQPLAGCEDALVRVCLDAVAPSRAEPGCLFFDVFVGDAPGGAREVGFYEAYVDEAAFRAHMAAPHTARWQAEALPLLDRSTVRFPAHRGVSARPT